MQGQMDAARRNRWSGGTRFNRGQQACPAVGRRARHAARVGATFVVAAAALTLPSCSSGPTTKAELCDSYDELSEQLLEGNGIFGNPLFKAAGKLGRAAENYEGDASVRSAGEALSRIADSDETTGGELSDAAGPIGSHCGRPPLAFNALMGPDDRSGDDTSDGEGDADTVESGWGDVVTEGAPLEVAGGPLPDDGEGAEGMAAPKLTGSAFDGSPVTVGGPGEAAVVMFVTHWSSHSQESVPVAVRWAEANPDVRVVFVSCDARADQNNYPPSRWFAQEGASEVIAADCADAASAYGLNAYPYTVAVDGDGNVAGTWVGTVTESDLDRLAGT